MDKIYEFMYLINMIAELFVYVCAIITMKIYINNKKGLVNKWDLMRRDDG